MMAKDVKIVAIIAIITLAIAFGGTIYSTYQISTIFNKLDEIDSKLNDIARVPEVAEYLDLPEWVEDLIDGARQEGQIMIYGWHTPEELTEIIGIFQQKYPFMEASFWRSSAAGMAERMITEYQTQTTSGDISGLDLASLQPILEAGAIETYLPPTALEDLLENPESGINYDPDGYWVSPIMYPVGFAVNTELISDENLWPTDWTDFIDPPPEWQGMALPDPRVLGTTFGLVYDLYKYYGAETTREIFEGIKSLNPMLYSGHGGATSALAAGEVPLMFTSVPSLIVRQQEAGAPVKWLWPESGCYGHVYGAFQLKMAAHPYAGRLFLYFLLTNPDIMEWYANRSYYVFGKGAPDPAGGFPPLSEANIFPHDPVEANELRDEILAIFNDVFGA